MTQLHSSENGVRVAAQQNINLLPYLLLIPLAYLIYNLVFPSIRKDFTHPPSSHNDSYNFLPAEHPPCTVFRKYTPKELSAFDGKGVDERTDGLSRFYSRLRGGRRREERKGC